jgi:hypothetical protein
VLPTLNGRIQTRIFLLLVVGGIWTLLLTPMLPLGASIGAAYGATFVVLLTVLVLGVAWELVYHLLQQFRWEKDWPTMYALFQGIPEGIIAYLVIKAGVPGHPHITEGAFAIHFSTVWFLTWLFAIGPMRVPFIRWRFRGGRLV